MSHTPLSYSLNVLSSANRPNLKTLYIQSIWGQCIYTLFATAQQPHSWDIFINQKILPLDKQINQQEGILAYNVINGTYMLNDFLIMEKFYVKSNLEMIVTWEYHYMP